MAEKYLWTDNEWTFDLLKKTDDAINKIAVDEFGLDIYRNQIEVITADQMLSAYSSVGMPIQYEHWSHGKQFVRESKAYKRGAMGLAYEIVINSNPCISYLMEENTMTMQALVIAHACYGHNSFFKGNYLFRQWTDADSIIDYMIFARTYIRQCEEKYGMKEVEDILDSCHALMNHGVDRYIKPKKLSLDKEKKRQDRRESHRQKMVNDIWKSLPPIAKKKKKKKDRFPKEPTENLLHFIEKNAPLLKPWQREVIRIVRKISQYFYPQRQTQVMNEGWACVVGDTLIDTDDGLFQAEELVKNQYLGRVWDGDTYQNVINWFENKNKKRIKIKTKHGYELHGGYDHKILINGQWKELQEISMNDSIVIQRGNNIWPTTYISLPEIGNQIYTHRSELFNKCSLSENIYWDIKRGKKKYPSLEEIAKVDRIDGMKTDLKIQQGSRPRKIVSIPSIMDEKLATWLGMMIGDGNICSDLRESGFTSGDNELIELYQKLSKECFNVDAIMWKNNNKCRINSKSLFEYLTNNLKMKFGYAADRKEIPDQILQSPKSVVSAFIRGLFDTDGCVDKGGNVIYVTKSEKLGKSIQELLLKYGIVSKRSKSSVDQCYTIFISGIDTKIYFDNIGFNLTRKHNRLNHSIKYKKFYKRKNDLTEIISIEYDEGPTYDFSVSNTHCYRASAFINHNCFWHHHLMNELVDRELITEGAWMEFIQSHTNIINQRPWDNKGFSGINVYTLGYNIYRDLKRMCDNPTAEDKKWFPDLVGSDWNETITFAMKNFKDESFILQYLSPKVIRDLKLFSVGDNQDNQDNYLINNIHDDDGYTNIKMHLSNQYNLSRREPDIQVYKVDKDGDRTLHLRHYMYNKIPLGKDTGEVLKHLYRLWGFNVILKSVDSNRRIIKTYKVMKNEES